MQPSNFSQLLFLFSTIFSISLQAQDSQVISGTVIDSLSHETIIGAHVYTEDGKYYTLTNEYGQYTLKVKGDYNTLITSYIGYKTDTTYIVDAKCHFKLVNDLLPEIEIKATSYVENQLGRINVSSKQLKQIPSILGEVDIIKSMTMLPGVSGTIEGSSGLVVRGGSSSQNLILLDGATVYNPAHLFGFVSMFNPQSIKHVELMKSGFPAEYGGRLSSVFKVNTIDGNEKKRSSEFSIGLINNAFITEGPLLKGKMSYMLAGRLTNFSLLLSPTYVLYKLNALEQYFNYGVYDVNAKINYKISDKQKLFFSVYHGRDNMLNAGKTNEDQGKSKLKWGNSISSVKYYNSISPSLFFDATFFHSKYSYNRVYENKNLADQRTSFFNSKSTIQEFNVKPKFNWIHSSFNSSTFGVEASRNIISPYHIEKELRDSVDVLFHSKSGQSFVSLNAGVFYEHSIKLGKKYKVVAGGRYMHYSMDDYSHTAFEPRFSLYYYPSDKAIWKLSYDEMAQNFHLNSSSNSGALNDVWIPASSDFPVAESNQISLGYSRQIPILKSFFSAEIYFKNIESIIRSKHSGLELLDGDVDWEKSIRGRGITRAYGLELLLRKDVGRFTGWIGYTWSNSESLFIGLNKSRYFPTDYTRRHDLELTGSYVINDTWSVSSNFVYQTGRPITLPDAIVTNLDGKPYLHHSAINRYLTAPYHRLDVSFTKSFLTKKGRDATLSFGVYNLYANNNPFSYDASLREVDESDLPTGEIIFEVEQTSLLNFIPSINYSLKF